MEYRFRFMRDEKNRGAVIGREGMGMKRVASKYELASVLLVAIVLSGCMRTEDIEDGVTSKARDALMTENMLTTNSIDLNGLVANSIDLNGIDPELLSTSVLSALRDTGELGTNTRILYKYLVGCALDSTQSISFSWTDLSSFEHEEVFWGKLGIAPTWKDASISVAERRSVSACIAARANYYGTTVSISLRGPQASLTNVAATELAEYTKEEGAFWGDIFDGTPQLFACHQSANIANSRSKLRDCAAGHWIIEGYLECAHIAIVGDCDTLCDALDSTDFYRPRCDDDELEASTTDVITVFLPE